MRGRKGIKKRVKEKVGAWREKGVDGVLGDIA